MRSRHAVVVALAAGLLVGGCSSGGEQASSGGSTKPSSAAAAGETGSSQSGAALAEQANIDPAHPPTPLGSVTMNAAMQADTTVTIDLLKVEKRDKTLVTVFGLTPHGNQKSINGVGMLGQVAFTPRLIDSAGLKAYDVVKADNERISSDLGEVLAEADHVAYVYAVFPLPPESVKELDVAPVPGAGGLIRFSLS